MSTTAIAVVGLTRIQNSFAAQEMKRTFGAELTEIEVGHIRITAPILPLAMQQQGFGHADLAFSIGDSAAGYSALTLLGLDSEVVTAEMKINCWPRPGATDWS